MNVIMNEAQERFILRDGDFELIKPEETEEPKTEE